MDWRLKLFQILACFGEMEGVWYDGHWKDFGITEDEQEAIEKECSLWEEEQNGD